MIWGWITVFSKFAEIINRAVEDLRKRNLDTGTTYEKKPGFTGEGLVRTGPDFTDEGLAKAVTELETGLEGWLPYIYAYLVSDDPMHVVIAASAIADYMKKLSIRKIIQLDDRFREYTIRGYLLDYVNWETVDVSVLKDKIVDEEKYLWVLRLGTFHPNGYFREKCINELASDPASYLYLLLRLRDWVPEVRNAAMKACSDVTKLGPEDVINCLHPLEKLKRSMRIADYYLNDLERKITDRIDEFPGVISKDLLGRYDENTRRALYRLLLDHKKLSKDEVCAILSFERYYPNQRYVIQNYIERYEVTVEELDEFIDHRSTAVQRCAIEKKFAMTGKTWDGLEEKLLSPSLNIREIVRYYLIKDMNFDCRAYYIAHLEGDKTRYSILGLGEAGKPEDADLLMKYLGNKEAHIVSNTLRSLARLRGTACSEVYWKYLTDERRSVVKQAYNNIRGLHIRYGAKRIYELLEKTEEETLRKKLLILLINESYWDRVPYLLMLFKPQNGGIPYDVLRKGFNSSSTYSNVSESQAKWIEEILEDEEYKIPEKTARKVRFDLSFFRK